jgi:enterochelin esterase family protein
MRTVQHEGPVIWRDRQGRSHEELRPTPVVRRADTWSRVVGPLERAWEAADDRDLLAQTALSEPNPSFSDMRAGEDTCLWTWVVEAPQARSVLLWINPVFDHRAVDAAEMTRLSDSDLWTICLRLPTALRASYRVAVWESDESPAWQTTGDRREVIIAARDAGTADPRGVETMMGPADRPVSIAHGPTATPEPWRPLTMPHSPDTDGSPHTRLTPLPLRSEAQAWVHAPVEQDRTTPLVVVFDGARWKEMGLPRVVDQATEAGVLPPVHLALLDVADPQDRGAQLGVPGGQVDVLLDDLLPRVRAEWNVSPHGSDTIVAGQSLGGIAALWTLALGEGSVGHAVAQSPSLWRFDVAESLLAATEWDSIHLQAGLYEGHMIATTMELEKALTSDDRLAGRSLRRTEFTGGHDWAAWRAELITAVAQILRD